MLLRPPEEIHPDVVAAILRADRREVARRKRLILAGLDLAQDLARRGRALEAARLRSAVAAALAGDYRPLDGQVPRTA